MSEFPIAALLETLIAKASVEEVSRSDSVPVRLATDSPADIEKGGSCMNAAHSPARGQPYGRIDRRNAHAGFLGFYIIISGGRASQGVWDSYPSPGKPCRTELTTLVLFYTSNPILSNELTLRCGKGKDPSSESARGSWQSLRDRPQERIIATQRPPASFFLGGAGLNSRVKWSCHETDRTSRRPRRRSSLRLGAAPSNAAIIDASETAQRGDGSLGATAGFTTSAGFVSITFTSTLSAARSSVLVRR